MTKHTPPTPFDPAQYRDTTGAGLARLSNFCQAYFHTRILSPRTVEPSEIAKFISLITHDEEFFGIAQAVMPTLGRPQGCDTAGFGPNVQHLLKGTNAWRHPPLPPVIRTDFAEWIRNLRASMEESRLVLERMRSDDSSNPVLVEATENYIKFVMEEIVDPDMKSYVPRSDIPIIRFETAEDYIAYVRDHRKMRRDLNRKWERQYADGDFGAAVPVPVAL